MTTFGGNMRKHRWVLALAALGSSMAIVSAGAQRFGAAGGGRAGMMPMARDSAPVQHSLFRNIAKITTSSEATPTGIVVVQTSDDATVVAELQAHAAEVNRLVEGGMAALHESILTKDPQALAAIHQFLAFQRTDHRAH